jgi:hypothetical protein
MKYLKNMNNLLNIYNYFLLKLKINNNNFYMKNIIEK